MPRRRSAPPPAGPAVLIDANVWIAWERNRDPAVRLEVARLRKVGRAAFVPPVLLEFARGLEANAAAFEFALARFRADFREVPLEPADWLTAIRLARTAAPGRHPFQVADLLLAAVAARTGFPVWSADPDLDRLADAEPRVTVFHSA